jgi:hypothetical protein
MEATLEEYELGDLVQTSSGTYIGVVFWKGQPPGHYHCAQITEMWYQVLWNDGDITDEDGSDMKLYIGGDDHGNESRCEKAKESRQESSKGSDDATTCGEC